MQDISAAELCRRAEQALNPQDLGGLFVADVACAVVAEDGSVHTGASIGGYLGLCAEQSAVSAMVSHGPPRITMLAAVWRDADGALHALPPCGRCREFLRLVSQTNLDAGVVLGLDHVVPLRDLLPSPGWTSQLLWSPATDVHSPRSAYGVDLSRYTDTCDGDSAVNGPRSQSLCRDSSSKPAS